MLHDLLTLVMLVALQVVLGFDNLLYISIESQRVEPRHRSLVRRGGIAVAIVLRIALLFAVVHAIEAFRTPFARLDLRGIVEGQLDFHAVIVLFGGVFVVWTALRELAHMLGVGEPGEHVDRSPRPLGLTVLWIALMNAVFSFDSILSAIALTHVFWVMAVAIVFSGALMMLLADRVAAFLERNRIYEVLGLFILLVVGLLLLSEGGHLAHLVLLGHPVEPMAKSTFYFVVGILVAVDLVQARYQRRLAERRRAAGGGDTPHAA